MKAIAETSPRKDDNIESGRECLLILLTVIPVDLRNVISLIVAASAAIALFAWPMKIVRK